MRHHKAKILLTSVSTIFMRGFRKPTKMNIILEQKEVIESLLKITNEQSKLIADMSGMIERQDKTK